MKLKERIEELERRVRELEARPISYPPVYVPYPVPAPAPILLPITLPSTNPWWWGQTICANGVGNIGIGNQSWSGLLGH